MKNNYKQHFVETFTQYMEQERDDLSPTLIHMTKSRESLIKILETKFLKSKIDVPFNIPKEFRHNFKTVSFTEMPISQISKINKDEFSNPSNRISYYALLFRRKSLQKIYSSLNPVLYIFDEKIKEGYCNLFSMDFQLTNLSNFRQIGPYVKFISETNNFYWEREWRYLGDFKFSLRDISYILVATEYDANVIADSLTLSMNYPSLYFKIIQDIEKVIVYEFNDNLSEEDLSLNIRGYYIKTIIKENGDIREVPFKTVYT